MRNKMLLIIFISYVESYYLLPKDKMRVPKVFPTKLLGRPTKFCSFFDNYIICKNILLLLFVMKLTLLRTTVKY